MLLPVLNFSILEPIGKKDLNKQNFLKFLFISIFLSKPFFFDIANKDKKKLF